MKFAFKLADIQYLIEEQGDTRRAMDLLTPLIARREPEALYWYSQFSVSNEETKDEFESRSIRLLTESAEAGFPPANFALAVCYQQGDLVEKDERRSAELFRKAAEGGLPQAQFEHGLNLVYGINGIKKNKERGLVMIRRAAKQGVEAAAERLGEFTNRL